MFLLNFGGNEPDGALSPECKVPQLVFICTSPGPWERPSLFQVLCHHTLLHLLSPAINTNLAR